MTKMIYETYGGKIVSNFLLLHQIIYPLIAPNKIQSDREASDESVSSIETKKLPSEHEEASLCRHRRIFSRRSL
ncbi:hypothetical protein LINPERHAP1_LOCUS5228 [Linum perenne]